MHAKQAGNRSGDKYKTTILEHDSLKETKPLKYNFKKNTIGQQPLSKKMLRNFSVCQSLNI